MEISFSPEFKDAGGPERTLPQELVEQCISAVHRAHARLVESGFAHYIESIKLSFEKRPGYTGGPVVCINVLARVPDYNKDFEFREYLSWEGPTKKFKKEVAERTIKAATSCLQSMFYVFSKTAQELPNKL